MQRHAPRFIIASLIALIILAIVVDQATQGCCSISETMNATQATCSNSQACLNRGFDELTDWIARETFTGVIVLTVALAFSALVLIPAAAVTIGSGAAFARALGMGMGVLVGSLVVFVGLSSGAMMAFLLARYLLYECVQRQVHKWRITSALDAALKAEGLKVMLLLRLSPLIPYNVFNYMMAATSVSLRDYSIALFAMVPATFGYVYIGATIATTTATAVAATGAESASNPEAETLRVVLFVVGAVCTLVAVIFVSLLAKKQLTRSLHMQEAGMSVQGADFDSAVAPPAAASDPVEMQMDVPISSATGVV